ncbi:MAG TPA: hypothetical protein DCM68_01330, partial [Verrucomicrobia bacterium]|nr:hypothetical protein [Verrucomicrobiota bacterium]
MSEGLKGFFQNGRRRIGMGCGLAGLLWMAMPAGANADDPTNQCCASLTNATTPPPAEKTGDVAPAADGSGGDQTNRAERQKQDLLEVQTLQMQSLFVQQGQDSTSVRRQNPFTRWLDRTHQQLYRRMDNAVRWVDTKWLAEDAPYDAELSTFNLRTIARVGGRSSEGAADFKVRVRADVALPGLERKLRLIVD